MKLQSFRKILSINGYWFWWLVVLSITQRDCQPAVFPNTKEEANSGRDKDTISYAYVIRNGLVIDPATGNQCNGCSVAISGDSIAKISADSLCGQVVIDAAGCIVSAGFIDIQSYLPSAVGIEAKLLDGVTTQICSHGYIYQWNTFTKAVAAAQPANHYGATFYYNSARWAMKIPNARAATAAEQQQLVTQLQKELAAGLVGVSFAPEYSPGMSSAEIAAAMTAAKPFGVPAFFHARYSAVFPACQALAGIYEIIELSKKTGVPVHIQHITSTGATGCMEKALALLDSARKAGIDISACLYPYTSWATFLNTPRFAPGWQQRLGIGYEQLILGGTDERLNAVSFQKYQSLGRQVCALAIPEQDVLAGILDSTVLISSDGHLNPQLNNHPRCSGTFARVLGKYVRAEKRIDWWRALRKMSWLPAQRLVSAIPSMKRKGKLQVGADADIVVIDTLLVADRATIAQPEAFSVGMRAVFLSGKLAAKQGKCVKPLPVGHLIVRGQ